NMFDKGSYCLLSLNLSTVEILREWRNKRLNFVSEMIVQNAICVTFGNFVAASPLAHTLMPCSFSRVLQMLDGFPIRYHGDEWDNQTLQVFLVPHSHNDPGWLKTFDGYYRDQTRHILDNMLQQLTDDPQRKMIWAEVSYFSKWWDDIDEHKRSQVQKLLKAGQLELVTGGWVMADEANSHYYALIDQLLEGHQWIQRHLGVKPTNGWAIDPFGHSPSMSYLLKGAGLKNHVIQRVHYSVKKHFAQQRLLEFSWRQPWDSASSADDITCHMMPFYSYDVPHTCGPDPAVCCQFDFHRLPGGRVACPWRVAPQPITEDNVKERARLLLDQYRQKSRLFRSPVLLVPLGDDFRFVDAREWEDQFSNYQRLFQHMNQDPTLHVQARFGTLADYFEALQRHLDSTQVSRLPAVGGDFFTYADRDDHYWSGYYTSRPFYKRQDRHLETTLRYCSHLCHCKSGQAQGRLWLFSYLTTGRRNLGLFQHHDAVTGTAKDAVVRDYGERLRRSVLDLRQVIQSSAHFLLLPDKSRFDQSQPLLQTDKPCRFSRLVVVYNSLEQRRTTVVTVTVDTPYAAVTEVESGRPITAQISVVWEEPTRASKNTFQLSFIVDLPPLSLSLYHVTRSSSGSAPRSEYHISAPDVRAEGFSVSPVQTQEDLKISNEHLEVYGHALSGLMQKLRLHSGQVRQVQVQFLWYGTRSDHRDKSGAYLFLPGDEGEQVSVTAPLVRVSVGPVFSDITSCFPHVTHRVRLFHIKGHEGRSLQIQNTVDIRSEFNRELVMRLVTDVANGNHFSTDINGFQMLQRRTLSKIPLQANFYPMTTAAFIQDQDRPGTRLTLLSAQSQAVAALKPGFLELVLDRRLQQDDNRGLGQGVTDNKRTESLYHLLLEVQTRNPPVTLSKPDHNTSLTLIKRTESLYHLLLEVQTRNPPVTLSKPDHNTSLTLIKRTEKSLYHLLLEVQTRNPPVTRSKPDHNTSLTLNKRTESLYHLLLEVRTRNPPVTRSKPDHNT
uniref:Alpha-mannosidase n=1 Tax=Neogobius melanostomus TaxID=47308 RepID=A0A8C6UFP0_9GOBI